MARWGTEFGVGNLGMSGDCIQIIYTLAWFPSIIKIPVDPLPGVETNGLLINWSLVPSWVNGCRLPATWLHTGYPVAGYHPCLENDSDFTFYKNTPTLISQRAQVIL